MIILRRFLVLFALMMVLALAMVSIVAAAVREGNLPPGAPAPGARERPVRFAAAIAAFVVAAVLSIGVVLPVSGCGFGDTELSHNGGVGAGPKGAQVTANARPVQRPSESRRRSGHAASRA